VGKVNDETDSNPKALFTYAAKELNRFGLACLRRVTSTTRRSRKRTRRDVDLNFSMLHLLPENIANAGDP